jgi:hypothetical protein
MPSEMKDHWFAAFRHAAGLGPHPGDYKGPPRRKRAEGEPTETDLQSAREEPLGELNAPKMKAAMRGGDLGPEQFEQEQVKQAGAIQQQSAAAGQQKAAQAQAGMTGPTPPTAPAGTAGVTEPYPAQEGALPTAGNPPKEQGEQPPAAPG